MIFKYLRFGLIGVLFGVVMTKSEAISWFRIVEMFRFDSFHMYGIIGTAVVFGILLNLVVKRSHAKNINGDEIKLTIKDLMVKANFVGGTIFGLGWALSGACPGPMFTLLGHGVIAIGLVIIWAVLGAYVYGLLRSKLPH